VSVFGSYARYYDLLYRDKDYKGEVDYVTSLIRKYAPEAKSCLELGSGTGRHAELLSEQGFETVGVDQSAAMVEQAQARCPQLQFHCGDLRKFQLGKTFDTVMALFHVVSYQTENKDLQEAFRTVDLHLKRGGIFLFDCWHGPAVLHQRPEVRVKRLEADGVRITRIAEPEIFTEKNLVSVNYNILINEGSSWNELSEVHNMRYLFRPEVELLLEQHNMRLIRAEEWMSGRAPDSNTWGVVYVAVAE
jgi:SAM-dependent methyltransferase